MASGIVSVAKSRVPVVCVFFALVLGGPAARACSCASESIEMLVARADLAVVATPLADAPFEVWLHDAPAPLRTVRTVTLFQVDRILEGASSQERIAVLHGRRPAACGISFLRGVRYLLAFRVRMSDEPAPLRIGLCGVRVLGDGESASNGGPVRGGSEPPEPIE